MWLWDNWRSPSRGSVKWTLLVVMNVVFFTMGFFCTVAGSYSAIKTIHDNLAKDQTAT